MARQHAEPRPASAGKGRATRYVDVVKLQASLSSGCTPPRLYTTRLFGSPAMHEQYTSAQIERFWSKVDRNGPIPDYRPDLGPCWLWTGHIDDGSYGAASICVDGKWKQRSAHGLAFRMSGGEIPTGLELDHLCRIRRCVRPSHLEPVTSAENSRRRKKAVVRRHLRSLMFPEG